MGGEHPPNQVGAARRACARAQPATMQAGPAGEHAPNQVGVREARDGPGANQRPSRRVRRAKIRRIKVGGAQWRVRREPTRDHAGGFGRANIRRNQFGDSRCAQRSERLPRG
jgi:hypothetical protein